MPTPDELAVAVPPSPPVEAISLRSSCPPEEERHAPREARDDDEEHETIARQQMPTPEPETQPGASIISQEAVEKGEHVEHTVAGPSNPIEEEQQTPTPTTSPVAPINQNDVWLAHQVVEGDTRRANEEASGPRYLTYPRLERHSLQPYSTTSFLRPGSKFKGTQQSDRQVYDVQVEIKDVDLAASYLCGYLRIQGLTDDHPTLTTFFHSEIIGPHHAFLTSNPVLHSTPKIDLQHWSRFPAFRTHHAKFLSNESSSHLNSAFTLEDPLSKGHLFMRWKELFLVPDHRVKSISGASFEGFYYICFDQRVGSVSGIYFHAKSEKFQQLELHWVRDGGAGGSVEFR